MDILLKVGAVALLALGAVYPIAAIVLMGRLLHQTEGSPPSSLGLMVRFLLIATVPLAGILGGVAGLVPNLWASPVMRVLIIAAAIASLVGFAALAIVSRTQEQP